MEEKKNNSSTVKNIIIVILSICVVVLGGMLLYSKAFKKDTPNNKISNSDLVNNNLTVRNKVGEITTLAGNFMVNLNDFQVSTVDNKTLGYAMLSKLDVHDSNSWRRYDFSEYCWDCILQASSEGIYVNSEKDYSGVIYKYDNSGNKLKEFKPNYVSKDQSVNITFVDNDLFFANGTYLYNGSEDSHKIKTIIKDGDYTFIDVETDSCGEYGPEVSIKNNVIIIAPGYNELGINDSGSLLVYYPSPAGDFILAEHYDCGDYGTDDFGMGGTLVTKSGKTIGKYYYGAEAYTVTGELIGPYYSDNKDGIYIMDSGQYSEVLCRYDANGNMKECK